MKTRDIALIALFAALTTVSSFFRIPIPLSPVPITLQVAIVILSGLVLGKKRAALSQVTYVLIVLSGLPTMMFPLVPSGIGTLLGPTGGYIIGFVFAAFFVGWLAEIFKEKNIYLNFLAGLAGIIIIYFFGVAQLMFVMHLNIVKAFLSGAAPFVLFDIGKAVVAAFLAIALTKAGVVNLNY